MLTLKKQSTLRADFKNKLKLIMAKGPTAPKANDENQNPNLENKDAGNKLKKENFLELFKNTKSNTQAKS